jgi:hypothetical protein
MIDNSIFDSYRGVAGVRGRMIKPPQETVFRGSKIEILSGKKLILYAQQC